MVFDIEKFQAFALLLTKLRTGLFTSILRTLFNVKSKRYLSRIVKRAREALVTDFVPKYLGFENISREDIIENHTTVFARELLASGSKATAILLLVGTFIYIQKSSKYTFHHIRSYSVYKGRPLVKPLMIVASDGYIIDIFGPYMADGKNNDAAILNKHLLSDENGLKITGQKKMIF